VVGWVSGPWWWGGSVVPGGVGQWSLVVGWANAID